MHLWVTLLAFSQLTAQQGYRKPPQAVLDVLNAPMSPLASVSPSRTHVLLRRSRRYPSIAEVSQPMLRLAGIPLNPRTNGPHLGLIFYDYELLRVSDGQKVPLALPRNALFNLPQWSPDGKWFAFTATMADHIELWVGEAATGRLRMMPGIAVNASISEALQWMPDSRHVLVKTVVKRGPSPRAPEVPPGPKIQESAGKYSPVRTLQDLLTSAHDMDVFDYHMTSQLMVVDTVAGTAVRYGEPAVYTTIEPAPDGRHVMLTKVHRPYSLLHAWTSFPQTLSLHDRDGKLVRVLFEKPLEDSVPIEGVGTGPRFVGWRPDEPATLFWVEALDGGNPKSKVPHRDKLMTWKVGGQPAEWTRLEQRFRGVDWGKGFALVRDYERDRRWQRTLVLNLSDTGAAPKIISSRSSQDRYRDPGTPLEHFSSTGHRILEQDGDSIFLLNSTGATPKGARPFLDRLNIKTGESKRIFRSAEKGYERPWALLAADGSKWLTERESPTEPPNYVVRSAAGDLALTHFTDPTPQLRKIQKRLVTYKRPDGVDLSFTLYLPPDFKEGTRLPTVVWAYPREYADAEVAGQFGGSTERFTTITGTSHLFYLLAGYAVLDDASMPVVGPPETQNNTYVEQIVASAKAAIDKAAELGVTDPTRVGVGGHSYGAFMTANLLAHSDLFRAGVARSGAYNRTLTPFGFQAERRTLWEAPDLYLKMSPFLVAHKVNEPLLLIHGEADNNAGTFPIQSDRMYQAVRGNGGTVRLVFLPNESHGYVGRESVEHTLAEMI
ncbi:MAG: prolyl oligopeptidase family serine peptidase, partial [Acidobacteria bacterium]|nr:prolyl oligopeptidase family serine peptidase [Acidobacteriota bacterium]